MRVGSNNVGVMLTMLRFQKHALYHVTHWTSHCPFDPRHCHIEHTLLKMYKQDSLSMDRPWPFSLAVPRSVPCLILLYTKSNLVSSMEAHTVQILRSRIVLFIFLC